MTFSRAGLPVPRTYWLTRSDASTLTRMLEDLGGFPVVLKTLGYSHGVGVMRCDTMPGLLSVLDFALAQGHDPLLTSYVEDAVHWRLVVVGDEVVSSYRNVNQDRDFRTSGSDDPADYAAQPPAEAERIAVAACHALRLDHGGVDVLEHPSGRLYVLEANYPCYYAQSQLEAGDDIAGAMMDYLLSKAERLSPASDEPFPELTA